MTYTALSLLSLPQKYLPLNVDGTDEGLMRLHVYGAAPS